MPTLTRQFVFVALSILLSGCLHLQLGSGIADTTITVTPLRDPTQVIQQTRSPSYVEIRDLSGGAESWEAFDDLARLILLGTTSLDRTLYEPDQYYLITAAGGEDYDVEADGLEDADASPVAGQWHAIVRGSQIQRASVTALTEVIYRSLELRLSTLTDADLGDELELAAERLVADIDRSGDVEYADILAWNRQYTAESLLVDVEALDEIAVAVRASASASQLRELSLEIVGEPAAEGSLFNVSGRVLISSNTRVDSDVNDTRARFAPNNSRDQSQELINPVVLGGYANVPLAGESGASFIAGDADDYFRANLLEGQLITLVMADDPGINDLDLYLYNESGELVDASLGLSELEQLEVPADGTYDVVVTAFIGASNYRLSLGIGEIAPVQEPLRLSDDFVPGELIARFHSGNTRVNSIRGRERITGMRVRGGGLRRANLMRMPRDATSGDATTLRKLRTIKRLKRLRRSGDVESADLNYYVSPALTPNDAYYRDQRWHYEMINLPAAWDQGLGDDVIVAVVDTGVLINHQDFSGQLVDGYDFIADPDTAADGDGIDPNPDDPGDASGASRSSFHGTHVAGTIAAASNNARGVSGVAWNARIVPLRALGVGGGTSYDVLQAVRFAAGLENDSGELPARAADIINLSLSGGGFSSSADTLYREVSERGIIVVAAAGNEASSAFAYPASYTDVFSVSAVNINRERASYSNFGSRIDLAAPGGDSTTRDVNGDGIDDLILSMSGDDSSEPIRGTYALLQGTSMASPHVAGVFALMKSVYPALSTTDLRSLLQQGLITDDLGTSGRDNSFGYGLINANRAMLAARALASGEDLLNSPSIGVSASALNFGTLLSRLPLTLSNAGTGELFVSSVSSSAPWLTIAPEQVDDSGLGQYAIEVDRSQLAIGSHSATIEITSVAGDASVQVILQQPDPDQIDSGDVGFHYILLIHADTGEVEQEVLVNVEDGAYDFTFTDVPAGDYQIYAGGDADNDFFICDPGEACGAWPVLERQAATIQLRQNLSDLEFPSTFNTGIISTESVGGSRRGLRRSSYKAR